MIKYTDAQKLASIKQSALDFLVQIPTNISKGENPLWSTLAVGKFLLWNSTFLESDQGVHCPVGFRAETVHQLGQQIRIASLQAMTAKQIALFPVKFDLETSNDRFIEAFQNISERIARLEARA